MSALARPLLSAKIDPVQLDPISVLEAENVLWTNPVVFNVVADIINDAFAVEPVVTVGGSRMDMTENMKDLLEDVIVPCCKRNIRSIFTIGVGLIVVAKSQDPRWKWVVKYPEDGGVVRTYYDYATEEQKFFYERGGQNAVTTVLGIRPGGKEVRVISGFGYDPSSDGMLRSRVASVTKEHCFITHLQHCYSEASSKAADPFVFTQLPQNAPDDDDKHNTGFYGDRRKWEKRQTDMYNRSKEEADAAKRNNANLMTLLKFGHSSFGRVDGDPYSQQDIPKDVSVVGGYKIKPLQPGHVVGRVDPPQFPPSFERLKEMSQETFNAMMGGGRAQLSGKDSKTAAGTNAAREQYNRNLSAIKKMAGRIMTECYNMLYRKKDSRHAIGEFFKVSDDISLSGAREAIDAASVKISLPQAPNDNTESMFTKYCMGSITKDEMDASNRMDAGLSSETPESLKGSGWQDAIKIYGAKTMLNDITKCTPFGKGIEEYARASEDAYREKVRETKSREDQKEANNVTHKKKRKETAGSESSGEDSKKGDKKKGKKKKSSKAEGEDKGGE